MEEYKYEEITKEIIGCGMKVHSILGKGFPEVIYQRALAIEFKKKELGFEREKEMPIYYKDYNIGARRVDFLVEGKVLVEIKAITEINDLHHAQILNYLTAYNLNVGLLINFGEKSLKFKRFVH
jgi:GxxExxY protein